jgi:hypothetical protein
MRNVLFEDVAEPGVNTGPPPDRLFAEGAADPKMEWGAGVEGGTISAKNSGDHARIGEVAWEAKDTTSRIAEAG